MGETWGDWRWPKRPGRLRKPMREALEDWGFPSGEADAGDRGRLGRLDRSTGKTAGHWEDWWRPGRLGRRMEETEGGPGRLGRSTRKTGKTWRDREEILYDLKTIYSQMTILAYSRRLVLMAFAN